MLYDYYVDEAEYKRHPEKYRSRRKQARSTTQRACAARESREVLRSAQVCQRANALMNHSVAKNTINRDRGNWAGFPIALR